MLLNTQRQEGGLQIRDADRKCDDNLGVEILAEVKDVLNKYFNVGHYREKEFCRGMQQRSTKRLSNNRHYDQPEMSIHGL